MFVIIFAEWFRCTKAFKQNTLFCCSIWLTSHKHFWKLKCTTKLVLFLVLFFFLQRLKKFWQWRWWCFRRICFEVKNEVKHNKRLIYFIRFSSLIEYTAEKSELSIRPYEEFYIWKIYLLTIWKYSYFLSLSNKNISFRPKKNTNEKANTHKLTFLCFFFKYFVTRVFVREWFSFIKYKKKEKRKICFAKIYVYSLNWTYVLNWYDL